MIAVHENPAHLNGLLSEEADARGWAVTPLNRALPDHLKETRPDDRGRATEKFLLAHVRMSDPGPIVLTEIDILFTPELYIDPLRLLTNASQFCPLVVSWPGSWDGKTLAYATPDHGHYKLRPKPDAAIRIIY